ncbi:DUF6493 family protein [Streptomyces sp. NBC_01426]|uniref:DUF7824 domain-containing protein n=1 Tax=Streptomyces sp. NBC_01426 TaxID=2975866 RepID=UPI002E32053A|nr:DUF6493 family protein [Streptomyces sp. NBC_01426]
MTLPMNDVLDAVRAGRTERLPALLGPLTPAERRAVLGELTALRREVRGWGWDRGSERDRMRGALLVAGAGCHTGAAAAASWIGSRELRDWREPPAALILELLADRDPKWLGDVAHRLAARAATAEADYPLIRELVRLADCAVPTTDAFVSGWVRSLVPQGPGARLPLSAALRRDPFVRHLVPRLFETAEPPNALLRYSHPRSPNHWPTELAALAEEGIVERRELIDGCVSRLLRGGRPNPLRFYLVLLERLALTPAEERDRTADWIAMAADAPSALAGHAQRVLARLTVAGELSAERLAEMSAAVLLRPEKKLARAQLILLGKALRRAPDDRHRLLPAVAHAFGHEDTALQERALGLVAAHLRPHDEELRAELAVQSELLSPGNRLAAAAHLGVAAAAEEEPYEEILPPPPVRRRVAATPSTVAETVELVAALIGSRSPDAAEFETALDGLVRHAHRDRAALVEALAPVLAGRGTSPNPTVDESGPRGLELVAAAVLERFTPEALRPGTRPQVRGFHDSCVHGALRGVIAARLREVAHRMVTTPLPFLLATPTWETGTIEPDELVERLTAYHRLGVEPAEADFAQALLRVRRDPTAAAAATALGTPPGARLAAWLTTAGEPPMLLRRTQGPDPKAAHPWWGRTCGAVRRIVIDTRERLVLQKEFPPAFRRLGRPVDDRGRRCWHWHGDTLAERMVLPEDRETQAAWLLPDLTAGATGEERGPGALLPGLAELGGPAGPVLHLAVATGLGSRHAEDRLGAVDALLVLAGRGELDAPLIGRDLAELVGLGTVKANRLADSARTAAATGAYATTWTLLAGAIPALLARDAAPPPGTGELLAVAADCVERCRPASPDPEGLAVQASRPGSSRLVAQARRLRTALAVAAA